MSVDFVMAAVGFTLIIVIGVPAAVGFIMKGGER